MQSTPTLGRWLAIFVTAGVFAVVLYTLPWRAPDQSIAEESQAGGGGPAMGDWVMYGGTPARNMVNATVKKLPQEWDVDPKAPGYKFIRWEADLGSKAYGGPIVAGGKVFIGTNNQKPREKFIMEKGEKVPLIDKAGKPIDLGILMAFEEKKGKFLWQQVFFKLPAGRVHDWPLEGLCSTPVIEGDRLYYVSNRCEVVCSKTDGSLVWKLDMMKELGVIPHNIAACSPLVIGNDLWIVTANGVDDDHINVPAPQAPSFIRVDKVKGKVTWKDNTPTASLLVQKGKGAQFFKTLVNRGELIQHGQWSNPAYAVVDGQPQVVFPGGDGWIYSFDPKEGKLLWRFDCNPKD